MPEYRRAFVPGGTFFLTIVTAGRRPLFADRVNVTRLRDAITAVGEERPFVMLAHVILPDHLHMIWELPEGDSDFSTRVGRMKVLYTKSVREQVGGPCPPYDGGRIGGPCPPYEKRRSVSQVKHRESGLWQRRFWEHTIHDERDFERHVDYIHYNPVRHELATCPHAWTESSFSDWVRRRVYDQRWGYCCDGQVSHVALPEMNESTGE